MKFYDKFWNCHATGTKNHGLYFLDCTLCKPMDKNGSPTAPDPLCLLCDTLQQNRSITDQTKMSEVMKMNDSKMHTKSMQMMSNAHAGNVADSSLVGPVSLDVWHQCFGHLGLQNLKKLISGDFVRESKCSTKL